MASKSKKGIAPPAGVRSITSFFTKKPESPAAAVSGKDTKSPQKDAVVKKVLQTPPKDTKSASSPATSSSGAKTTSKLHTGSKVKPSSVPVDLPKKMDLDDSPPAKSKSEAKPTASPAKSPVETVTISSSESPPDTVKLQEGSRVEVLFDKKKWYQGTVGAFDKKKNTWRVTYDDGEEDEISFPDPEVRVLGKDSSPPKQDTEDEPSNGRKRRAATAVKKYILDDSDDSDKEEESSPSKPTEDASEKTESSGPQRKRVRRVVQDSDDEESEEEFDGAAAEESSESEPEEDDAESASSDEEASTKKSKAGSKRKAAAPSAKSQKSAPAKRLAAAPSPAPAAPKAAAAPARPVVARSSFDRNTVSEQKKTKQANFEAKNQQRYKWLEDIKDAAGKRPSEEGYDPRTLLVPSSAYNNFTNFEKQFWDIKKTHFDVVLFFKKGKFYEMFEGDADVGHNLLHLKLTDRTNMRMCGIPEKQFATYASQLVGKGFKVGRVEQMETMNAMQKRTQGDNKPKSGQVCERELCQVLTQGTLTDETMVGGSHANFLLALCHGGKGGNECGVCLLEASTGMFYVGQFEDDAMHTHLETLLLRARPRELVYPRGGLDAQAMKLVRRHLQSPILNAVDPDEQFWDDERTEFEIDAAGYFKEEGGAEDEEGSGGGEGAWPEVLSGVKEAGQKLALSAVGGCLWYLRSVKLDQELASMRNFRCYGEFDGSARGSLVVDGQTLCNLEVLENSEGRTEGTLLRFLDRCVTGFGRRKFRGWVCAPLRDPKRINERLDAAERLAKDPGARDEILKLLRKLPDVERSLSQVHMQASGRKQGVMFDNTSARKLRAFLTLLDAITLLCDVSDLLQEQGLVAKDKEDGEEEEGQKEGGEEGEGGEALPLVHFPPNLRATLEAFKGSYGDLHRAMEEGYITPEAGVHEDYDAAVERVAKLEAEMEEELQGLRKTLKERSLKFWHPAAGKEPYQIEVPTTWLSLKSNKLPSDFELKSQTGKVRRYWTSGVRKRVLEMVDAKEALAELREGMAKRMQLEFDSHYACWLQATEAAANLDCLISLSYTAEGSGDGPTCRPRLLEPEEGGGKQEAAIEVKDSWHPCLSGRGSTFIQNDIALGSVGPAKEEEKAEEGVKYRACVVTGPNMGGKSTLLRQACVAVLLAQVGAFVPGSSCVLRCCDRIFTRIGASDRIMAGQSTFLVELAETATILRHATAQSLVVLDELGRGTSTHDGFAIAGAVLSHLVTHVRPLLLFSTHYHALTDELRYSRQVGLYHMDCLVNGKDRSVTFLYKFKQGVASDSYGLHCAKAAGLPKALIDRAAEKRGELEAAGEHQRVRQLSLFKSVARLASGRAVVPETASICELQQETLAVLSLGSAQPSA